MIEWKRYPRHVPKAKEWYLVHGEHMGETFVECDYYDNDLWQYRQLDVTYWADLNLPQGIEPHWPSQDTDAEKPHNEETYNWMEALEMIEQGQPVCHPKLPSHVFIRGKNGQIMCQLRGKQYELNNIAIKTIFQGLLHDGWHNHQ